MNRMYLCSMTFHESKYSSNITLTRSTKIIWYIGTHLPQSIKKLAFHLENVQQADIRHSPSPLLIKKSLILQLHSSG